LKRALPLKMKTQAHPLKVKIREESPSFKLKMRADDPREPIHDEGASLKRAHPGR